MSTRATTWSLTAALAVAGLLAIPGTLRAQDDAPPPTAAEQPLETELVFERELFQYPSFQRRNPFRPLVSSDEGGPRFEQLRLIGVLYSEDPGESVAVVGTSRITISDDGTRVTVQDQGDSWYLKVGQSIGNTRIVEIRRDEVAVEIEEFGLTEQRTMQLETRRLGGTP